MRKSGGIEFWRRHNEAYEAGGVTQAEYCARHHLSRKTFARWRTIIRTEGSNPRANRATKSVPQLVRVDVPGPRELTHAKRAGADAEHTGINIRGVSWEVRLDVGFDQDVLCRVLTALRTF